MHGSAAVTLPDLWELTRGISLHDWQRDCVEAWFQAPHRGVLKVVTGAGKTLLALAIAERLQQRVERDLRIAIVVPTVVLLNQWLDEFRERSNLPADAIGSVGGGRSDVFGAQVRVLICVLNSAAKKLASLVEQSGIGEKLLLIVDECHRAGSSEMRRVFETKRAFSLGLSATPERDDDADDGDATSTPAGDDGGPHSFDETTVGQALGPVIYELTYAEAIDRGILPPFQVVHYGLSLAQSERDRYDRLSRQITDLRSELETGTRRGLALIRWCRSRAGAGNPRAQQLLALTSERKRLLYQISERAVAAETILQRLFAANPEGKAILFHESIDEVMRLFTMLHQRGFPVVAEHSGFPDSMRAESLRLFRDGTARIIVSARSLIEGFNVPSADVGIILAASASVRQRVQTLGRLLRRDVRGGIEKVAALYVLYAAGTVDELIYEKADWEQMIGAERNDYFIWKDVRGSEPERRADPPRRPLPTESSIDVASLVPGGLYPGDPDEGGLYTVDTQGTIRDDHGALLQAHPELSALLKSHHRSAGRFHITPMHHLVIKLQKAPAGWQSIYLGRLSEAPQLAPSIPDDASISYEPGDAYPLGRVTGRTFSVLLRDKRLIAEKTPGGVRFVVPVEQLDARKAAAVAAIQQQISAAHARGHRISKLTVTPHGDVVYVFNNEAYFLGAAPNGEQGFEFEELPARLRGGNG